MEELNDEGVEEDNVEDEGVVDEVLELELELEDNLEELALELDELVEELVEELVLIDGNGRVEELETMNVEALLKLELLELLGFWELEKLDLNELDCEELKDDKDEDRTVELDNKVLLLSKEDREESLDDD